MIASRGSPIAAKKLLMIPFFSSRTCHAIVRSKKFIHIGRINTKIMKPFFPSLRSLQDHPKGKGQQQADHRTDKGQQKRKPECLHMLSGRHRGDIRPRKSSAAIGKTVIGDNAGGNQRAADQKGDERRRKKFFVMVFVSLLLLPIQNLPVRLPAHPRTAAYA